MIGIIDYGLGNLFAISRVFEDYQIPYKFCKRSECLETVSKIILPGVGTFDYAIELEFASLKANVPLVHQKAEENSFEKNYSGYFGQANSGNTVRIESEFGSVKFNYH